MGINLRRIVAALAAILVTLSLTVATAGSASAREHRDHAFITNPFTPRAVVTDICERKPWLRQCRDRGELNVPEPKPVIKLERRPRATEWPTPPEPRPIVRR